MNKVIGGTPKGNLTLCSTCRHAQRLVGINLQTVIHCQALARSPVITFPVSECSLHDDKRLPSLEAMREIAWEVKSRNRGAVGFAGNRDMDIVVTPPSRNYGAPEAPEVSGKDK